MDSRPQKGSARNESAHPLFPAPDDADCAAGFRTTIAANDTRMSQLARTIEQEIIPRLMLAHRAPIEPLPRPGAEPYRITTEDVSSFSKLVLSHDENIALATVRKLRDLEVSVEMIYVELLAPTARYLGTLWEDDRCSFTDVTVGLGRLQRVLRELGPALGQSVPHPADGRRILLLPSPGDQHTFGLVMVAEFFRRDGWHVTGGAWTAGADAAALSGAEWFDVVGFSLSAEVHLERLAAAIAAVRTTACNRDVKVLVGGPLFAIHPEYVERAGADGMTIDGREAPALAEALVARPRNVEVRSI